MYIDCIWRCEVLGTKQMGRLGDGTSQYRFSPVDVLGLSSGVHAIAVGNYHTCALTTRGGAKWWGHNTDGQLSHPMVFDS